MPKDCKTCEVSKRNSLFLTNLFDKLYRKRKAPEQSGTLTVTGKKVELSAGLTNDSRWRYLVKFRTEDGTETQLAVSEEFFNNAKDGASGTALWQGGQLISFAEKE